MQEALAYFLRSLGNAGGTAHKARLTWLFGPTPILSNMGFTNIGTALGHRITQIQIGLSMYVIYSVQKEGSASL